ncbi:MAG: aminotransferase class V-fold PLP-dependent enzyme [Planctomycetes bacterium]|nr:aminotransferase class V-fold PLP-dependent enzyme [Planctomycetota bacterium]
MTDALARLRAAFPVAGRWIYFNHAAVAPMAAPVADAVAAFCADARDNGSVHFEQWLARREHARSKTASLLGALPEEIALTTSTSQGLITVAEGLRLAPGDEILVVHHDFPANQIPWFRQQKLRGAKVVVVPRDADGRVPPEAVLSRLTPRTRVVALPFVLYDNGYRLDLEAIGRGLADHPALFCVDAIQGLGAFPLDVRAARIDFLSADSHKWMLGMEGIGVFYCRHALLDELDTPLVSWTSVEDPFRPYEPGRALLPDARRFEYAAMPTMEVFGLDACLDLLLATGVEAMSGRILSLTDTLAAGLLDRGWTLACPRGTPGERSGIVVARPPSGDAPAAVDALAARGVSVTPRGGGVRFSPHAWNTAAEVSAVLDRLPC